MDAPIVHLAAHVRSDGVAVVDIGGELDIGTARRLREGVSELPVSLQGNPHGHAIMDLTELSFCDAAGVRALLAAIHDFARRDVDVTVTPPKRTMVHRVLTIAGLDRYFRESEPPS
jgi:anti-anti-sigma factor